jgi:hypothetical protein
MPSQYAAFEVYIDNDDGTVTPVANQAVKVFNVMANAALADVASDPGGTVPGATVNVNPGTRLRFSVQRADGLCGYAEVLTA